MLRTTAIAQREGLPESERRALTVQLEAHLERLLDTLSPTVLAFCWPYRAEPDLRDCITRWIGADATRVAVLPVVLDEATPLVFRRWTPGMEMPFDRHGIPHPVDGQELVPDVVLVPFNVCDDAGFRLGYGGGYFDRTLARIDPVAVGVGFELGRTASVFPLPHDKPMHWIVTERAAQRAAGAVGAPLRADQARNMR